MTLTVTVLLGIGVLFIASALDCTPLVSTTQKIISNQPIDWTGQNGCGSASTNNPYPGANTTIGQAPVTGNTPTGQIPAGRK